MKKITTPFDNHGLNEAIQITAVGEKGPGGAHHRYEFEEIVTRYWEEVLYASHRRSRDWHLAEDVTQEAFSSLYADKPYWEMDEEALRKFLFGAAKRQCLHTFHRVRGVPTEFGHQQAPQSLEPWHPILRRRYELPILPRLYSTEPVVALPAEVATAWATLTLEEREIIEGMTDGIGQAVLADSLGLTVNQLKSRYLRVIVKLKRALGLYEGEK